MSNSIQLKLVECEKVNEDKTHEEIAQEEFKKVNIDEFEGEHRCPLCGFEWND